MELKNIVPWGRSYEEYVRMFALTPQDLEGRILSCADGPASFNCHATAHGTRVVSIDPLYQFTAARIRGRIDESRSEVLRQARKNANTYVWSTIRSVEELGRIRMAAMTDFLVDFEQGHSAGRYVPGSLPELPFPDGSFDLAVCSHFLFLYSAHLSLEFHCKAVLEMCRVAADVRIFPLLTLAGEPSDFVGGVRRAVTDAGYSTETCTVPYEFQRGGNQMLRIWSIVGK